MEDEAWSTEYGFWSMECSIGEWKMESGIWDTEHETLNRKHGIWNRIVEYGV